MERILKRYAFKRSYAFVSRYRRLQRFEVEKAQRISESIKELPEILFVHLDRLFVEKLYDPRHFRLEQMRVGSEIVH